MRKYLGNNAGIIAFVFVIINFISITLNKGFQTIDKNDLINFSSIFGSIIFKNISLLSQYFSEPLRQYIIIIEIVFLLMLLVGGILFLKSKRKNYNLLKFGYLVIGVSVITEIITFLFNVKSYYSSSILNFAFIRIGIQLIYFFISYQIYFYFREKESYEKIEEPLKTIEASKSDRFFNFVFDFILFGLISGYLSLSLSIKWYSPDFLTNKLNDATFISLGLLVSYLISEVIFKSTPTKCLTNTRVFTLKNSNPSILQFVGRSFARMIPFNPFSFIGEKGWHDSLTKTKVVKLKSQYHSIVYLLWPLLVIGLMYGVKLNNNRKEEIVKKEDVENKRIYKLAIESVENTRKSLQEEDYIFMHLEKVRDEFIPGIGKVIDINQDTLKVAFKHIKQIELASSVDEYEKIKDIDEIVLLPKKKANTQNKINVLSGYDVVYIKKRRYNNYFNINAVVDRVSGEKKDTIHSKIYVDRKIDSLEIKNIQGPIQWLDHTMKQEDKTFIIKLNAFYENVDQSHASTLVLFRNGKAYEFILTGYKKYIKIKQKS